MHVENESAEIVTTGEHEFEEIIGEYEEEVLEAPLTDSADTAPVQGKPRCITLILTSMCSADTAPNSADTAPVQGSSSCYA
jgi:hypothetical protein